jgi:hypothetical protein
MCMPGRMRARNGFGRSWPTSGRGEIGAPLDEVSVEGGHEVGEVRRVRSGRITTRERVIAFEPPLRYAYEILSGLPIRGYVAEVMLSPITGGERTLSWVRVLPAPRAPPDQIVHFPHGPRGVRQSSTARTLSRKP